MGTPPVTIIGGGPAGLTAAYVLAKADCSPLVLEKSGQVGGIARTETYKGYRFDIGGHRFFTKVGEVEALWHELMGEEMLEVDRLSRIYYDGKFFHYPIELWDTLGNLGPVESAKILFSYLKTKVDPPYDEENTFEQFVTNRFGGRLYHMFFKTYTEKVWGIPCDQIRADWAAQRIKGLSAKEAILDALSDAMPFDSGGGSDETSLINRFLYPRKGPGQMWERTRRRIEEREGAEVRMHTEAVRLHHDGGRRVETVEVRPTDRPPDAPRNGDGQAGAGRATESLAVEQVINSMPIDELVARLEPAPPSEVLEAAAGLSYRDFLIVALVIDAKDLFPDNWIYVHEPGVQVGRIQNFKNWSPDMVPDASMTCLGMEYFCNEGDRLWETDDATLIQEAEAELRKIGLAGGAAVVDGTVIRQRKTYPVYDGTYKQHLSVIQEYLGRFENLQTVGRAGMHRYNNQDHSMLTALLAAKNILGDTTPDGELHDVWNVNVERSYHEDFTVEEKEEKEEAKKAALKAA